MSHLIKDGTPSVAINNGKILCSAKNSFVVVADSHVLIIPHLK